MINEIETPRTRIKNLEVALLEARRVLEWAEKEGLLPEEADLAIDLVRTATKHIKPVMKYDPQRDGCLSINSLEKEFTSR